MREGLSHLTTFGIAARCPGADADSEMAERAMAVVEKVRIAIRSRLGLS